MPEGPLGQNRPGTVPRVEIEVRTSSMPEGDPDIFSEKIEAAISEETGENITVESSKRPSMDDLLGSVVSRYKLSPGTIRTGKFQFTADSLRDIEKAIESTSPVNVDGVFLQVS